MRRLFLASALVFGAACAAAGSTDPTRSAADDRDTVRSAPAQADPAAQTYDQDAARKQAICSSPLDYYDNRDYCEGKD